MSTIKVSVQLEFKASLFNKKEEINIHEEILKMEMFYNQNSQKIRLHTSEPIFYIFPDKEGE